MHKKQESGKKEQKSRADGEGRQARRGKKRTGEQMKKILKIKRRTNSRKEQIHKKEQEKRRADVEERRTERR